MIRSYLPSRRPKKKMKSHIVIGLYYFRSEKHLQPSQTERLISRIMKQSYISHQKLIDISEVDCVNKNIDEMCNFSSLFWRWRGCSFDNILENDSIGENIDENCNFYIYFYDEHFTGVDNWQGRCFYTYTCGGCVISWGKAINQITKFIDFCSTLLFVVLRPLQKLLYATLYTIFQDSLGGPE